MDEFEPYTDEEAAYWAEVDALHDDQSCPGCRAQLVYNHGAFACGYP